MSDFPRRLLLSLTCSGCSDWDRPEYLLNPSFMMKLDDGYNLENYSKADREFVVVGLMQLSKTRRRSGVWFVGKSLSICCDTRPKW